MNKSSIPEQSQTTTPMRRLGSRRFWSIALSSTGIAVVALFLLQKPSTPFHVGSPVEDIWKYIHTDAVSDRLSVGTLPLTRSTRWIADIETVTAETSFIWKKTAFAVRTTIYSYKDGVVTGVDSKWKIK